MTTMLCHLLITSPTPVQLLLRSTWCIPLKWPWKSLPYRCFLLWFLVEDDIPGKQFFAKYGVQASSQETFLENCLYELILKMCLGWAAGSDGTPACISHARPDVFSPWSAVQTELLLSNKSGKCRTRHSRAALSTLTPMLSHVLSLLLHVALCIHLAVFFSFLFVCLFFYLANLWIWVSL